MTHVSFKGKRSFWHRLRDDLVNRWILYVMILPAVIYYIIYHYIPMYGVVLAFKDIKIRKGILGSSWVGLEHFQRLFSSYQFPTLMRNTLTLSLYGLVVGFPIPIIFALLLNYLKCERLKRLFRWFPMRRIFCPRWLFAVCSSFSARRQRVCLIRFSVFWALRV